MLSLDYRRWISSLGCCVDSCSAARRRVDACHTGCRGLGQKTSDLSCVPFCRRHHEQFDLSPRAFADKHGLDIPELVQALNQIGLAGLKLHRPARNQRSPQFIRTVCICGWRSGWFRVLQDAQGSLHSHIENADKLALAESGETDAEASAAR